ncbi:ankyrin repeat domain-containing protein [Bizionia argentinensis JUB59]|uniref:Ankyrin repeat domain-containing protein n=1 Tax=Bizionia argentinensis JUB59 TaxID=1046627 RepID=G2EF66_9FLAO|nr:ankyrin repeat domain-containing protein [Bizionia argentinensis]EGV42905.1 ankyrin repeat domain-containing protein [Bizionia argentinensis JUB59]
MNIKAVLITLTLVLSLQSFAQDNVFLNREFWKEKPSIKDVDAQIKAGHDITEANGGNFDGVVYAILQNAPNETIKYIQSIKGNDVNKLTHDGRTYIFWAANIGNTEIMGYLLKKGAKTDITDDKGSSILNFAAGSGQANTEVYDMLLENGANLIKDLTPYGANALLLAAPYDVDFKLIEYFTSKGIDIHSVDANGNGIFNYAAKQGNTELLEYLLKRNVKPTDQAFMFAAQGTRGHTNEFKVYKYLENVGLNPNVTAKDGQTPLHILGARSKNVELISYFIDNGVNVNQADTNGNTALINAAYRNNLDVISLLLKQVGNINAINKKGESALALAVKNNSVDVVDFLISNNADVAIVDANGNNLVAYAIESFKVKNQDDFEKKIELLKVNGLDISNPQANGNSLFHLAVQKQDLALVKWANNYKVDINQENNEGNTALHLAALSAENSEVLEYLVAIGAKKETVTEFDETAFDLASENEILKSNHININFLK